MPIDKLCPVNTANPSKHIWWNSKTGLCHTCGLPHPDAKIEDKEARAMSEEWHETSILKKQAQEKTEYEKHIERHELLHSHVNELIGDYLAGNSGRLMSNTNLVQLLTWSYSQMLDPDDPSKPSKHIF